MNKRIENLVLLKVIGSCELLAGIAMIYYYHMHIFALIAGILLFGLGGNSFVQAHKRHAREYKPRHEKDEKN